MRETKSAFARRLGTAPSYITELAQAGRLVLADGQVEVEASLARIEATRDPNRDDVRQRHAKARDEKRLAGMAGVSSVAFSDASQGVGQGDGEKKNAPAADSAPTAPSESAIQAAEVFKKARAAKMHYEARRAVIRVARLQGRLADAADIRKFGTNDGATLRSLLENLPDQAAPRLAPVRDPAVVARIFDELLGDVADTLAALLAKNIAALREGGAT
jgi:hypothetical protein